MASTAASGADLGEFAAFARRLAAAAKQETLPRFARDLAVEDKSSGGAFDPVTEADRGAERAMRRLIEEAYPDHGIQGEEFEERPASSAYSWSLDPVDGTRSFVCGLPTWVTLLALLKDGEPLLGLIDVPILDETYIGTTNGSALERGNSAAPLTVSNCERLAQARVSTTDPYLFQDGAREPFERLRTGVRTVRYGHDGYAYARVAAGTLDLVVECGLKPHDYNALIPVVRGAGGLFGDWRGGCDFAAGNVIAAATPALYESAVAIMKDAG